MRSYYLQAMSALEIGKNSDRELYYYNFEEYCLEYILRSSCQNLIPESLCPSGLIQMREYDQVHGTQYIFTLKTYFDQKFNATHAAKKMYIHRTTLLERLNKISSFLEMNLDDPRTRLYLMISLEIIHY
jgi:DNA-binding PucR family transcriptional regulator